MIALTYGPITYAADMGGTRFKTITFAVIEAASDPYPFGEPLDIQVRRWNPETEQVEIDLEGIDVYGKLLERTTFAVVAWLGPRVSIIFSSAQEAAYYFDTSPDVINKRTRYAYEFEGGLRLQRVPIEEVRAVFEAVDSVENSKRQSSPGLDSSAFSMPSVGDVLNSVGL